MRRFINDFTSADQTLRSTLPLPRVTNEPFWDFCHDFTSAYPSKLLKKDLFILRLPSGWFCLSLSCVSLMIPSTYRDIHFIFGGEREIDTRGKEMMISSSRRRIFPITFFPSRRLCWVSSHRSVSYGQIFRLPIQRGGIFTHCEWVRAAQLKGKMISGPFMRFV